MSIIRVEKINFSYADSPILKNISFNIHSGELVSILGPNGCGKTTLLKLLLGLYSPDSGAVYLQGQPILKFDRKQLAQKIAYVPQVHNASFGYQVKDVVMMGRMPHKTFFSRFSGQDEHIALEALKKIGILHLQNKAYTRISGGERQLTLIARALAQGARIFILDEPLNGLDYGNQLKLLEQLHDLCREGYTFIKSTHFPEHALWIADHVIMLKQGKVYADGNPHQVITPQNIFDIYGARVDIFPFAENFKVCIPQKIRLRLGRSSYCTKDNMEYAEAAYF